jgi:hypothetical protein
MVSKCYNQIRCRLGQLYRVFAERRNPASWPRGTLNNLFTIIAVMMEVVRTSETSVNFNVTTRPYIPEHTKLYTRRRENLKSHMLSQNIYTLCTIQLTRLANVSI